MAFPAHGLPQGRFGGGRAPPPHMAPHVRWLSAPNVGPPDSFPAQCLARSVFSRRLFSHSRVSCPGAKLHDPIVHWRNPPQLASLLEAPSPLTRAAARVAAGYLLNAQDMQTAATLPSQARAICHAKLAPTDRARAHCRMRLVLSISHARTLMSHAWQQ